MDESLVESTHVVAKVTECVDGSVAKFNCERFHHSPKSLDTP